MASSCTARRAKGKDTSEYKVVKGHFGPLVKLSQHVLSSFANELFMRELISKLEHSNAIDKNQPMYDRATCMMDSVLTKIENDSSRFEELVACLREAEQYSIAKDLVEALGEDRRHYPSMPGATQLPQNIVTTSSTRAADTQSSSINNSVATVDEPVDDPLESPGHTFVPPVSESGSKLLPQGSVLVPSGNENIEAQEEDDVAVQENSDIIESQNVLAPILEEGNNKQNTTPIFSVGSGSLTKTKSTGKIPSRTLPHCMSVDIKLANQNTTPIFSVASGSLANTESTGKIPSRTLPHCMSVDRQLTSQSLRQLTSGYGKPYRSSPIGGDAMDCCIKPVHPLTSNPLIDALNMPILSPIKLVKMQRVEDDSSSCNSSSCYAQSSSDDEGKPPNIDRTPIAEEQKPAGQNKHPMVKCNSFQSVCLCHIKVEFLQMKLGNRMEEIDILKSQIEQLESHFEEERKRKTAAVETQAKLRALRDKEVISLKEEIASKNKLVHQLEWQKVEYEEEIEELRKKCDNTEDQRQIAELKANFVARRMLSKCGELEESLLNSEVKAEEYKLALENKSSSFDKLRQKVCAIEKHYESRVAAVEAELAEAKRRELKLKQQMVRTGYETVKSEMVAEIEACIDEKNATTWTTLAPLLQHRVEREMRRATQELDATGVKIAEDLITKTSRLIMAASKKSSPAWTISSSESREEIRALDLVTPDKDVELTW